MRRLLAVMLAGLLLLVGAGAASAAYTPQQGQLTVDRPTVTLGQSVQVSGSGYDPGAPVDIFMDGVFVKTVTTDGTGSFSTSVTPQRAGEVDVAAVGPSAGEGDAPRTLSATVSVVAAAAAPPGGGGVLPFTGAGDVAALVALALLLLVAGGQLVAVGARRSTRLA